MRSQEKPDDLSIERSATSPPQIRDRRQGGLWCDVIALLDQPLLVRDQGRDRGRPVKETVEGIGFGRQRKLVALADPNMCIIIAERANRELSHALVAFPSSWWHSSELRD